MSLNSLHVSTVLFRSCCYFAGSCALCTTLYTGPAGPVTHSLFTVAIEARTTPLVDRRRSHSAPANLRNEPLKQISRSNTADLRSVVLLHERTMFATI